jgi:isoaspartyl peptidase/L-asparaginase-like protein (Ntn-hydrolase superfamily)
MDRRDFIKSTTAAGLATSAAIGQRADSSATKLAARPAFIATWPFGKPACELALSTVQNGGSFLDGIEKGIGLVEANAGNASVGIGGIPNANGAVELDACIMSGPGHTAGSVAAVQDILHPISLARRVMEDTIHVMLVGEGAKQFALENGFAETDLLTDNQRDNYERWKKEQSDKPNKVDEDNHDTIAMLGVDENGNMFGGCSTSGWGFKIPGRVGDSPIIGSGLYVDNSIGGAGATGVGENVMRFCGSFLVVEYMRNGASPTEACQKTIERIAEMDPKSIAELDINFIALNKAGEFGAAGTSKGFRYSFANAETAEVRDALHLSEKPIGPEGGNIK